MARTKKISRRVSRNTRRKRYTRQPQMKNSRLVLTAVFFVMIGLVLIGQLYSLQLINYKKYQDLAERQYVRPQASLFDRGKIIFDNRDGLKTAAATIKEAYILYISPNVMTDVVGTYRKLSEIIELDEKRFMRLASVKDDPYAVVAHRVSREQVEKISALRLAGVGAEKERWRFYPAGNLASQTIGFVSYNGDDLKGSYGIEKQYEKVLSRSDDAVYVNFFAELFSGLKNTLKSDNQLVGDIELTIDQNVEKYIEDELDKYNEEWKPEHLGAIVMDPKTGEIIAAAHHPDFNLNEYGKVKDASLYSNPLVEDVYEMGSIMKPLTMATALDSGAVTVNSTYEDAGHTFVEGTRISNYRDVYKGTRTMSDIIRYSLNTGIAYIVKRTGAKTLSKYFRSFGMDEKTGIDLPNEATNIVTNLDAPRMLEHVTAGFGQGIALTPMATIRALGILANDGKMVKPHIAKTIIFNNGLERKINTSTGKPVLKPETVEAVAKMMTRYGDETWSGKFKMDGYSIAIKTGTAQIAKKRGRGYYENKTLHSFVGFFPSYEPRFIILFYAYGPQTDKTSTTTWTPHFFETVKFLINYYSIPPDR